MVLLLSLNIDHELAQVILAQTEELKYIWAMFTSDGRTDYLECWGKSALMLTLGEVKVV